MGFIVIFSVFMCYCVLETFRSTSSHVGAASIDGAGQEYKATVSKNTK